MRGLCGRRHGELCGGRGRRRRKELHGNRRADLRQCDPGHRCYLQAGEQLGERHGSGAVGEHIGEVNTHNDLGSIWQRGVQSRACQSGGLVRDPLENLDPFHREAVRRFHNRLRKREVQFVPLQGKPVIPDVQQSHVPKKRQVGGTLFVERKPVVKGVDIQLIGVHGTDVGALGGDFDQGLACVAAGNNHLLHLRKGFDHRPHHSQGIEQHSAITFAEVLLVGDEHLCRRAPFDAGRGNSQRGELLR